MFELIDKVTFGPCKKKETIIDYTFKVMKFWSSLVSDINYKKNKNNKLEALITVKQMINKLKALFSENINISLHF